MIISIIELISKPKDNTISLSQTVKVSSSIIKAKEISNILNVCILDHEIVEVLENKLKKTLKKMLSLDWHYAYRQLWDAGINNETAIKAIICKDYRENKFIITT